MSKTIILLFFTYFIIQVQSKPNKKMKMIFKSGEKINIVSGSVNSFKTQIPYDLYYLDICPPEDVIQIPANLGELLLIGKSYHTGYEVLVNETKKCNLLCRKKIYNTSYKRLNNLISKDYYIKYFLDSLPAGLAKTNYINNTKEIIYNTGIPIGFIKNEKTYIYNYYKINIEINTDNLTINTTENNIDNKYVLKNVTGYEIINFYIEPYSIKINENEICNVHNIISKNQIYENQILEVNEEITFLYDIIFSSTNITYENRFNKYFYLDDSIHWNNLFIGIIIIIILTIILILVYIRSTKNDNEIQNVRVLSEDEVINEYGWRNIIYDVFRRPYRSDILASFIGTGIQLLVMVFYSLLFVSLGIIQPKNGGSYFSLLVMVYIFLSLLSGYFSARFYKMVHGLNWLKVTILTALLFPIIFIFLLSIIDFFYWVEDSTTYVNFQNFFSLISLWLMGTVPLLILGTFIGLSQKRIDIPCDINPVPGSIQFDEIPWYLRVRFSWFITGFPSFFSIFVELFYIMDSLWKQGFYSLSKYLLISLFILIVTSNEIAILFTYLNLCKGDYRWWWKSFLVSASPALYIMVFSVFYMFNMGFEQLSSIMIYLNFMILFSVIIGLISGSTGVILTFIFLRNIYSRIKVN